ncbi:MAG: hypothetical protein GY934_22000 [Gammaproteobacteria bacterium]|nr:hypothetical protein [Gammaproteobacteria bacterium]
MNEMSPTERIKCGKVEEELTELDVAIDAAMEQLTVRQQHFAMLVAAGKPAEPAAVEAGYAKTTARAQAHRTLAAVGIRTCVELLRKKYALEHGWSIQWKRRQLEQILERAHSEESHAKSASAAVKVMRTILELDGNIKHQSNNTGDNVIVTIHTGVPRQDRAMDAVVVLEQGSGDE